jgi:Fe-S-cluster-containing dehydrogenase component
MDTNNTSRKEFLASLVTTGLVLAGCSTKKSPFETGDEMPKPTGEKVKLLSVNGEVIEVDKAFLKPVPDMPAVSNSEARRGIPGKKYVHSDLNWLKVYPMDEGEHTAPYWQPTTCMHCDEPPCVKVCPVDATFKRQDGIVLIDSDRCIGCRFCMAACPYSIRVFNWEKPDTIPEELCGQPYDPETSLPQKKGTVGKCDFCPDMARKGELPHCVSACPNGTFFYGDLNEDSVTNGAETFRFSDLIKDKAGYQLMDDLGTKPSVYYLPPAARNFPFEKGLENDKG